MAVGYKCGKAKLLMGIPSIGSVAIILAISYVYLYSFIPYRFPGEYTYERFAVEVVFYYFSIMTLVCIIATAVSDPGYLSLEH